MDKQKPRKTNGKTMVEVDLVELVRFTIHDELQAFRKEINPTIEDTAANTLILKGPIVGEIGGLIKKDLDNDAFQKRMDKKLNWVIGVFAGLTIAIQVFGLAHTYGLIH